MWALSPYEAPVNPRLKVENSGAAVEVISFTSTAVHG